MVFGNKDLCLAKIATETHLVYHRFCLEPKIYTAHFNEKRALSLGTFERLIA